MRTNKNVHFIVQWFRLQHSLSPVFDEVQLLVKSHYRGSKLHDYQSGTTITEVDKPLPKIKMQGKILPEGDSHIKIQI